MVVMLDFNCIASSEVNQDTLFILIESLIKLFGILLWLDEFMKEYTTNLLVISLEDHQDVLLVVEDLGKDLTWELKMRPLDRI